MADERTTRAGRSRAVASRTAVSRASHAAGGGHRAPNMHPVAVRAANAARGAQRTAHAIRPQDAHNVGHIEEDPMTHPLYQGMKFPEYEYREFPKWIHPDGAPSERSKIANNEEEERVLLAGDPLVREEEERVRLIKVAEVKGVTVDKRWGSRKLIKAIVDAGHDPDLNPFE